MSEWISVKERLPNNTDDVIVCHKNGYVTKNAWLANQWWFPNERNPITHWMPLPEPPKEEPTGTVSETETVCCADCKHRMFSDCYGECSAGYRGIVRPDDTCPHGERRDDNG